MNADEVKKFVSIILEKELFSIEDMESLGDEGAVGISRAKLNALINVVMKDATDEEKDAYRNDVADIYKKTTDLKVANTVKLYTDPDVLTAMGVEEAEHEKTIEEVTEQLSLATDLVTTGIAPIITAIKKMKL